MAGLLFVRQRLSVTRSALGRRRQALFHRPMYLVFVRIDSFRIDAAVVLARRLRCHIPRRLHHALYPGAVFSLQEILGRRDQRR